jgi:hypothetical protein
MYEKPMSTAAVVDIIVAEDETEYSVDSGEGGGGGGEGGGGDDKSSHSPLKIVREYGAEQTLHSPLPTRHSVQ